MSQEAFLAQCIARHDYVGTPLLAFRLSDLPQLSWKHGRSFARGIERRTSATFARICGDLLRDVDCVVHDKGSEWYAIVLYAPGRSGRAATPGDARSTLARVHLALEHETQLAIETGWTTLSEEFHGDGFTAVLEDALRKGVRERERYAFFSLIGHELRTPLTSIRGYLETVLEEDLDLATSRRFIEIAHRESLRIGRLVESLFDVSLLDLRDGRSSDVHCSVRLAVEAALVATVSVREQREATLSLEFEGDLFAAIHQDALTQILINLVDNAVKHGKHGGRIVLRIHSEDQRCIHVSVDDDGSGVPSNERTALFGLGERGSTEASGTGIGLGLVRLFLERVGGEITVKTSSLGGASFQCVLPRISQGEVPALPSSAHHSAPICRKRPSSAIVGT